MSNLEIWDMDCRDALSLLGEEKSVQTCITSPPYFGLRDYGHAGQIGLEQTPDAYVANLVEVFREVRRVLKDDGTLWLNLGDSYANNGSGGHGATGGLDKSTLQGRLPPIGSNPTSKRVADLAYFLTRQLEGGVLFFGGADPRGLSSESAHVLVYDQAAPDCVFEPLFRAQRIVVKNGQNNFCEIGGPLNPPVTCWVSRSFSFGIPDNTDAERVVYVGDNVGIVVTAGDLHSDSALRMSTMLAVKHRKAAFAVEVSTEPESNSVADNTAIFNSVTLYSSTKSSAEINPVKDPVALADGLVAPAGEIGCFSVRKALAKQVTFDLQRGGNICFSAVSHLVVLKDGVTPYRIVLDKAILKSNASREKQELGIPEMVKRALMEDGWICRQTIIWSKSNPMPESVRDRCTKSHEYLFMLSKSPKYYYDAEAIMEPCVSSDARKFVDGSPDKRRGCGRKHAGFNGRYADKIAAEGALDKRNRRSVWTLATKPFKGAHFATFPPELVEPCVLAGSRIGDLVLDPFGGSGTTAGVALKHGRRALLCEINPEYAAMVPARVAVICKGTGSGV